MSNASTFAAPLVRELRHQGDRLRGHSGLCEARGGGSCFMMSCGCWCHHDKASEYVEVSRARLHEAALEIERLAARVDVLYDAVVDAHDHLEELTGPDAPHSPRVLSADARLRAALDGDDH